MLKSYLLIGLMLFSLVPHTAQAGENIIGFVKTADGDAVVMSGTHAVKAVPNTPVYLGSVIKTGDTGSVGVTFKDDSRISIGHDTEVTIDEYLYEPAHDKLKLTANLLKGTLQYFSGIIAKLKPENVLVITPTGQIGVKGTHFLVNAGEG